MDSPLNAPLYSALNALARAGGLRFHLPGHKGRGTGLFEAISAIDYTEIPATGNLYDADGVIQQAEALAARYWGAGHCFFLTCGATQGIKAALAAFCGAGAAVVLDRNCHQSATDACALLDLQPAWLWPSFDPATGLSGDIAPEGLTESVNQSGARAVLVTSPTYYGHLLDIEALAFAAHSCGAALIVDGAHGSHLRACNVVDPIDQGADAVIFSAHKTLTALGQGALLLLGQGAAVDSGHLRQMTALFGTTSPAYPIMASLDHARALLEAEPQAWPKTVALCREAARAIAGQGFRVLSPAPGTDPCRLTVDTASAGITGFAAAQLLRQAGIEPEMADERHVVLIVTARDRAEDLTVLVNSFATMAQGPSIPLALAAPPRLPSALSPRQARFAPAQALPLARCAGRISARSLAPYPPGVPVVACGEIMDEKAIEYLLQKGYNELEPVFVTLP